MSEEHPITTKHERRAREFLDRFWLKVEKTAGCWPWKGCTSNGYGRIAFRGKLDGAHRVAWIFTNGEIPDGMWVLHKCDNPCCCRPDHLFLGTSTDNVRDMVKKNRHSHGERHYAKVRPEVLARGEKQGSAKLTADQVREIRERFAAGGVSKLRLSKEYKVSHPTIRRILSRRFWKHV